MITDETIRDQFKDDECMGRIIANRKKIEGNVDGLVSRRKSGKCKNQTSLDGWDIKEFAPDALFSLHDRNAKKDWCFRYSDIADILSAGVNPYNSLPLTEEQRSHLIKLKPALDDRYPLLPLSTQLQDLDIEGRCPLWRGNSPSVLYSYVCEEQMITDNPNYDAIARSRLSETMASRPCIGTLYRIVLNEPYKGHVHLLENPSIVERVETVSYGDMVESSQRPGKNEMEHLNVSSYPGLKEYMSNRDRNLTDGELRQLYLKDLRPAHTLTLYRGLNFNTPKDARSFFKKLGREQLSIGDTFTYSGRKNADSWSTNVCLATAFAMNGGSGIVIKYVADPEEIILDTRRLANRKEFYRSDQAEVIVSNYMITPKRDEDGRRFVSISDDKYVREVEVYLITKSTNSHWEKSLRIPEI